MGEGDDQQGSTRPPALVTTSTLVSFADTDVVAPASFSQGRGAGKIGDVPKAKLIGRRIKNHSDYFYYDENRQIRPTLNVFTESRPGGISVDVFWDPGSVSEKQKSAALLVAKEVCTIEAWEIRAWCVFTIKTLTKEASECVEKVIYTYKATNADHAEIIRPDFFQISEVDPFRNKKSRAMAKLLHDFALNHGDVISAP